ncbi:membrane cofactor protein-like isoform X3 [Hippopotamus amphibius kiboko]|uniref:membrane cofactor protein-like isoform X3 n=1 Tax=Hippopotamus amphibius kiboko TaxID=575201 RepID=UPI0025946F0E|nr:membrane cofactor protein-like isoform X3 [Hippopotamus amphibius kiboko]
MIAAYLSRKTPPGRLESPLFTWCFVGMRLVALVLLLPVFSDACGDPPRFETMRLQGAPKPSYRPGESIRYECRLGFQPMAPPLPTSAVCRNDNTWSPLQEACTRKSCPNLGDPVNGQVNFVNGSIKFGSQAHYVCNEGYYMIGSRILYCEISGESVMWGDDPPLCETILCATPRNITNGRFTSYKDEYQYNEIVTYSCNPSAGPDEYSLVGERVLVCVDKDRWSSDPPQCKATQLSVVQAVLGSQRYQGVLKSRLLPPLSLQLPVLQSRLLPPRSLQLPVPQMKNSTSQCNFVLVTDKTSKDKKLCGMLHILCDSFPTPVFLK